MHHIKCAENPSNYNRGGKSRYHIVRLYIIGYQTLTTSNLVGKGKMRSKVVHEIQLSTPATNTIE